MSTIKKIVYFSALIVVLIIVAFLFVFVSTKQEYEMLWMAYNASNQVTKYANKSKENYALVTSLRSTKKAELSRNTELSSYTPAGSFSYTPGYNVNGLIEQVSVPASTRMPSSEYFEINGRNFKVAATIDWMGSPLRIFQFSKELFIRDGAGQSVTLAAQDSLMEMITVPIYKISGETKNVSLKVRKEVAQSLKEALIELHNIKFPIENIGVHNDRWKSDQDTLGHPNGIAIDINSVQNPFCKTRVQINQWSSSESPFKINQQVINIMASHGFTWGIFGENSADIMHFSADGW